MLRPKAVEVYDKTMNGVVDDLIVKLRHSRGTHGLVTDIASEFYRFGLEGKIPPFITVDYSYPQTLTGEPTCPPKPELV